MSEKDKLMHLSDENFQNEIDHGVTLVDFYADWCGPCRMIAPIVEKLSHDYSGKAKIAKLDIEAAQNTTAHLNVTSIPTIIIFKDGKEFDRVVGLRDENTLKKMLEDALV